MKICTGCKVEKPESDFHKKGTRLAPRCKPCTKIYRAENYKAWSSEQIANLRQKNKERREVLQLLVREYKETNPCADCDKYYHFSVMDFDHISDDKEAQVSRLMSCGSWKRVLREIEKCELVCSNCHRVRTYKRLALYPSG